MLTKAGSAGLCSNRLPQLFKTNLDMLNRCYIILNSKFVLPKIMAIKVL